MLSANSNQVQEKVILTDDEPVAPCEYTDENDLCEPGDVVKDRWKVINKIHSGDFTQIYLAKDLARLTRRLALKIESAVEERTQLPRELQVLKQYQGKPHAIILYAAGRHGEMNFIAMQLVSENLSTLRRRCPIEPHRFSFSTAIRLTSQCLDAIRDLHDIGVVHGDVKPSNFAMGLLDSQGKHTVYILDFGLSRFYRDRDGNILPQRIRTGIHGTLRYCSCDCHLHKDVGRKDDIISLFYTLIEFYCGFLPWRAVKNCEEIMYAKSWFTPHWLAKNGPKQFSEFANEVTDLGYEDCPDYDAIKSLCKEICDEHGYSIGDAFDWENDYRNVIEEEIIKQDSMMQVFNT